MAKRLGIFRTHEFVSAGFPREYLRRLILRQQIQKLRHGLYSADSFDGDSNQFLVEAAKRFPSGVVCLTSALRFHDIGTQSPFQVWLALPRGKNYPRTRDSIYRFCKFSNDSFEFGVQEHTLPGGVVRVYSTAKTVVDCFKYRNRFGLDVAVEALSEAWNAKKLTLAELTAAADVCRVRRIIQPYLEMLT